MASQKKRRRGISLRLVYSCLLVVTSIAFILTMVSVYFLTTTFYNLSDAAQEHNDLEKAARELMDGSDSLTESVQRFTAEGDRRFMDEYFKEAFESKSREDALEKMASAPNSTAALKKLQAAMDSSLDLMNREYYAMRLVIEAKGITDHPELLSGIKLDESDAALSPEEKMHRASVIVLNEDYYAEKNNIRSNMQDSLSEIEAINKQAEDAAFTNLHNHLINVFILSIIQIVVIFFMIILTSQLGIKPVLKAVEKIKKDDPIPEIGANEFRYLAHTYNKMYSIYKHSLDRLNFKASHDELTGAYNRSGYELLLTSVDLSTTHLLLFDLDNFKGINDNYGHETGDRVLKKLVDTLKNNFRNDDYICRIGGDEFVVFMVHSTDMQRDLIVAKVKRINSQLEDVKDGLPPISVSVGIAHGSDSGNGTTLFEKADEAMYRSKQGGKKTFTFYSSSDDK